MNAWTMLGRQNDRPYVVVWSGSMRIPLTWRPEVDIAHVPEEYKEPAKPKKLAMCAECGIVLAAGKITEGRCAVCAYSERETNQRTPPYHQGGKEL